MFLSGVLFVLFLAGCWVYCLTDAALRSGGPGTARSAIAGPLRTETPADEPAKPLEKA